MDKIAPIALFVYNRFEETRQTLEALSNNELAAESILYVFADGPKNNTTDIEFEAIESVRKLVRSQHVFFKDVIIYEAEENKGLANSIITGVTKIMNKHGCAIVLEDDIVTSKYFLTFLNDGLKIYENVCNVYAVNAYMFPINTNRETSFLSPLATSSWGWASWANKWKAFEHVAGYKKLIQENPFLRARFNFAEYNYADMLDNENSWAIRWYYSVFIRNGLGVFPSKTLCINIGFGAGATHTKIAFNQNSIWDKKISINLEEQIDFDLHSNLLNYFSKPKRRKSLPLRVKSVIKRFINRL